VVQKEGAKRPSKISLKATDVFAACRAKGISKAVLRTYQPTAFAVVARKVRPPSSCLPCIPTLSLSLCVCVWVFVLVRLFFFGVGGFVFGCVCDLCASEPTRPSPCDAPFIVPSICPYSVLCCVVRVARAFVFFFRCRWFCFCCVCV